jgi:hypothetical protein
MQIKLRVIIIVLVFLSVSHIGCTKHADGLPGPAGPAGPAGANGGGNTIKASPITGFIDLFDQYSVADSSSAGVTVSTLKGDSLVTAITDSSGKFSLPPLPPGNYDINIKRPGFDSLKVFIQHSGGDEAKFIGIVRMDASLATKITGETISAAKDVFNENILLANLSFNGPPSNLITQRYFNFYFSRSKDVSSGKYDALAQSFNTRTGTNQYQFQYVLDNISNAGFHYSTGDTVYVKTCVAPPANSLTTWFDYVTYRTVIYPYLGDSTVHYFVWPL